MLFQSNQKKNQLILFITVSYSVLITAFAAHDFLQLIIHDQFSNQFLAIPIVGHLAMFALFVPLICKNQCLTKTKKVFWIAFCLCIPVLGSIDYFISHRRKSETFSEDFE